MGYIQIVHLVVLLFVWLKSGTVEFTGELDSVSYFESGVKIERDFNLTTLVLKYYNEKLDLLQGHILNQTLTMMGAKLLSENEAKFHLLTKSMKHTMNTESSIKTSTKEVISNYNEYYQMHEHLIIVFSRYFKMDDTCGGDVRDLYSFSEYLKQWNYNVSSDILSDFETNNELQTDNNDNVNDNGNGNHSMSFFFSNKSNILHQSFYGKIVIPLITTMLSLVERCSVDNRRSKLFKAKMHKKILTNLLPSLSSLLKKVDHILQTLNGRQLSEVFLRIWYKKRQSIDKRKMATICHCTW